MLSGWRQLRSIRYTPWKWMRFYTAATAVDTSKATPAKVEKKHQHKQTEEVVEA